MAKLVQLSRLKRAETRQQPYTVRAGDGCKVRRYKGEVLITLILVLDIIPLIIIYVVAYTYSK